jgi:hypothetical protein
MSTFHRHLFRERKGSRKMRWLAIAAVLVILQGQTLMAPSVQTSRVHLTFLDCISSPKGPDDLKLYLLDTKTFRHVESQAKYRMKKTALGVAVDISLAPGFYDVGLIGKTCSDETLLPVLKGRDQDALLIGGTRMLLRESSSMIAGSAPFSGYTASIAYYPQDQNGPGPKTLVVIPARVQGDSYYATGIPRGTARLRIYTTDGGGWIEFKIGMIGPQTERPYVNFDVSDSDIKNAVGHRM